MRYGPIDLEGISEVLKGNQIPALGPKTRIFETVFAEKLKVDFALAVSSCTAGLHLALLACGISVGDEVLVDPLFEFGTLAVLRCNAIPVYYDVNLNSYMPDVNHIRNCITSRTKAVIITNAFGCAADLLAIRSLCDELNIFFIEDCAHSLLCKCGEKYVGTIGDFGVFSFNTNAHLSLGEGGMIVSSNSSLMDVARKLRNCEIWRDDFPINEQRSFGWGYRISDAVAALGISQIKSIECIKDYHCKIGEYISSALVSDVLVHQRNLYSEHVYGQWVTRITDSLIWDNLKSKLKNNEYIIFGVNNGVDIPNTKVMKQYYKNDIFTCPFDCIFAGEDVKKVHSPINSSRIAKQLLIINIVYGTNICIYEKIVAEIKGILNECLFNPECENI